MNTVWILDVVKGRYYSNFHSEDFEVTAGSQTQEDMRLESAKDF